MRQRRVARWLLVGLALAWVTRPATTRACSPKGPETRLVRPLWPPSSGLQLVSESLELDCPEPNRCQWRSVHVYARTEPGEPAAVPLVLPFTGYNSLSVRWGEQPVEILTGEQLEQRMSVVTELPDEGVYLQLADDGQQLQVELEIEGEVFGENLYIPRLCRLSALRIRHPFIFNHRFSANTWRWSDYGSDAVDPEARTRVRVTTDRGLLVEVDRVRRKAGRRALSFEESAADWGVDVSIVEPSRIMGGPFIAIGGAILDANPVRGRIGWEHAYPYEFLFYSAALETDFTREFTFVPALEISHGATLGFHVLPRAGFGVGLPVQILPDPRPGLRAQFSLSWMVFSILTTFDWLPQLPPTQAGDERPNMLKLAFLGQFSF